MSTTYFQFVNFDPKRFDLSTVANLKPSSSQNVQMYEISPQFLAVFWYLVTLYFVGDDLEGTFLNEHGQQLKEMVRPSNDFHFRARLVFESDSSVPGMHTALSKLFSDLFSLKPVKIIRLALRCPSVSAEIKKYVTQHVQNTEEFLLENSVLVLDFMSPVLPVSLSKKIVFTYQKQKHEYGLECAFAKPRHSDLNPDQ